MSETTYTDGLVTLDNVIEEYLLVSDRPESDYRKALQLAIRGYQDLRLHTIRDGVKVTRETVSSIDRVDFPDDFVDFVSIGVPINGKVWQLTPNRDIVNTTTEVAGVETQSADNEEGVDIPNESSKAYYVRGGSNTEGYYKIEWDKRRIKLQNVDATTVILAYKTSGVSLDGTTYVPVKYVMTLNAFMEWWGKALNPAIPVSQKQIAEQTYLRLKRDIANKKYTLEDWEYSIYKTMYPLAKR